MFANWEYAIKCVRAGIRLILIITGALYIITAHIANVGVVQGGSMDPTLSSGDVVMIDLISPAVSGYHRYEIAALAFRGGYKQTYIKRIIGLPGETVEIRRGLIYIDGSLLPPEAQENPISEDMGALELGEDEYFVLGDNRGSSLDSRSQDLGPIKKRELIGTACTRLLPLGSTLYLGGYHLPLALSAFVTAVAALVALLPKPGKKSDTITFTEMENKFSGS